MFYRQIIPIDSYGTWRDYALTSSLLLFLTLHKYMGHLASCAYSVFALGDYDNWNSICKYQWQSAYTAKLIDGQTAFGYTQNLDFATFVDKNLKPWIEPKTDILGHAEGAVKSEIDWIVGWLFTDKKVLDDVELINLFNSNLLSAGSVHGDQTFSQKKQYYMARLGDNISIFNQVISRFDSNYDYTFYAS